MIDWSTIKSEYISSNISQRSIAEKYGVSYNTLKSRAVRESWAKEKEKVYRKITAKTSKKIQKAEFDRIDAIIEMWDKLLKKIEAAMEQLEQNGMVDVTKMRQIVQCLRDLKEIIKNCDSVDGAGMTKLDYVLEHIDGNI